MMNGKPYVSKELHAKHTKLVSHGNVVIYCGPLGTGKSSLIAAMAKYLKFDVYDLDLSSVYSNSDLMRVMRETSNRSIIVFEDIDCNSEVLDRSKPDKVANMDSDSDLMAKFFGQLRRGTNFDIYYELHKDKVDPALLRLGRMDMHIHLSYLKAKAFRILASNYLDIEEHHHPLLEQIDELLEKVEATLQ
ncbi:hypothetical protein TSUD_212020 [Trifolium subterraneum]|uniref:Uncharacterized protein n=1 Tax=Trifolium subterraneum TaxID=3900 RepID=A0A2Z6N2V6_TRISU|nr:hypothetical protein TSUD_212020 [Trifolium subterraneum]